MALFNGSVDWQYRNSKQAYFFGSPCIPIVYTRTG